MIRKKTIPIIENVEGFEGMIVVGTKVEYRLFGILFYEKTLLLPFRYGVKYWDDYPTRI